MIKAFLLSTIFVINIFANNFEKEQNGNLFDLSNFPTKTQKQMDNSIVIAKNKSITNDKNTNVNIEEIVMTKDYEENMVDASNINVKNIPQEEVINIENIE